MIDQRIFKAYDIRGTYPDQIDEAAVERIAGAYATFLKPQTVAVGRDVRLSGPSLERAAIKGLTAAGVNVIDIGPVPTEVLYFAVGSLGLDGGIQVSASHNPAEYNGLKMVKKGVEALSSDNGLTEIERLAQGDQKFAATKPGSTSQQNLQDDYLAHLGGLVSLNGLPKLRVVANNNFGLSGPLAKKLLLELKASVELLELNFSANGNFPKGRPDPLIAENRAETSALIRSEAADFGVAWDADGDRCYIADENGEFIEGCHLTALLAEHLLKKSPGQKIIYDPRNIWAVEETITAAGGVPLLNKAGHTFIKNRMKQEGALFAGEMSGHFYFRQFYNADNGLLAFLTFLEIMAERDQKVSAIVAPLRQKYFVSGEINFQVKDIQTAIDDVKSHFPNGTEDHTDGLSLAFTDWRFNLRPSNTEPLLRLNVEGRSESICLEKTNELTKLLAFHVA